MLRQDPFVGYRNKPNVHDYVYGFIRVDTNSLGYRGPEVSAGKSPGTFRILGLGDSVMWGLGVQERDTTLRVLEQELQTRYGESKGVRFEAVNTAVYGYSNYQELVTLERQGLPQCPDLVVLGFVFNDSYPSVDPVSNVWTFHQPAKEKTGPFIPPHEVEYPLHLLTFLHAVAKRQSKAFRAHPAIPVSAGYGTWAANGFEMESWPVLQSHLRKLKSLGDENAFHVLVLLFPTYPEVNSGRIPAAYQNVVGPFLASEKIPYIDLYDAFRASGTTSQFRDWTHPNVAGHRTVALEVIRYMQENHWLDSVNPGTFRKCTQPENRPPGP